MRHLVDVARTGLAAVSLHPLRSAVSVAVLVVALVPYLVGIALAKGIEAEAGASVAHGADLHVRGSRFGRYAPLPTPAVRDVAAIHPGVRRVVPRIVGEVMLGKDRVRCVLVGVPPGDFPDWAACAEGKPPADGGAHQLVIGTTLAKRLGLKVGSRLPPFYRNDRLGDKASEIVGVFKPAAPLWQSRLILTTLDVAAAVFEQPGYVTELLVTCEPGTEDDAARAVSQRLSYATAEGVTRPEVTGAAELRATLTSSTRRREGAFAAHFILAFVAAMLVLLVTSGVGQGERRREVGILKATGWHTDEVLLRGAAESAALSALGAGVSLLLAWLWLRVFNAIGISGAFLNGLDGEPDFAVPFRLTPVPFLLSLVLSFAIVLTGTLYSTRRAAVTPPRDVMR